MTKKINPIEDHPEFNRELLEVVSGAGIAWDKTKEEIWPVLLERVEETIPQKRKGRTINLQIVKYAAAAILLIVAGISSIAYFYTKTIETHSAKQTEILLPDHSSVTLYSQSVLTYKPILWKIVRSVSFEGEAFFEVQKGKKFEVVSRRATTTVLGTQFGIYSRNNDYRVECVSGKVGIKELVHQNHVVITAGQKAILKTDGNFEIITSGSPAEGPGKLPGMSTDRDQIIEEELYTVLTPQPAQSNSTAEEHKNVLKRDENRSSDMEKPEKNADPSLLKEQNRAQDQIPQTEQGKEDSKNQPADPSVNNEPEQNKEKSDEQKNRQQNSRNAFRKSLTPDQIRILEDQKMSREQRRKAFLESLSDEQLRLLDEQNKERSGQKVNPGEKTDVRENINEQQRTQMRDGSGNENREQQRQQNRENKPTQETGGNGNGVPGPKGK